MKVSNETHNTSLFPNIVTCDDLEPCVPSLTGSRMPRYVCDSLRGDVVEKNDFNGEPGEIEVAS